MHRAERVPPVCARDATASWSTISMNDGEQLGSGKVFSTLLF